MSAVVEPAARPARDRRLVPLAAGADARLLAFGGAGGAVPLGRFLRQVRALAACLPEAGHAINLCEDRYRFLLAFCAAAVRGQATLLPPSRAPEAVAGVARRHPGAYCLGDADAPAPGLHHWRLPEVLHEADGGALQVDPRALAVVGYTSGTTGEPVANAKPWAAFHTSTAQNITALRHLWAGAAQVHVVATVPPQHMYGMELSVLLPLLGDAAVHAGRPFFPRDIVRALAQAPVPRLLVTTPVHLRALLRGLDAEPSLAMPPLAGIVSATAPLPVELAEAAEARFACEVREVFGSTETCVVASRRSAREPAWTPFPGVRLTPLDGGCRVEAPQLTAPVALADLVDLHPDGRFELRGRNADLLEIAGKRASLGDLTRKLLAIPGVEDGVVFQLDEEDAAGVRRIAALAVAPGLGEAAILASLRRSVDPVFLPRRLKRVATLPHNATGKLPRAALLALIGTPSA
ncbi:MAG TPA: AMP-binding protein [Luteimonas sp.]|uniref:AMP-binding protein n=1 Tax=Xenophilus sp. TaxID=1873499 RepID=UPI002B70748B|nr:AMP-binding protein [Luteimonas sp.]